MASINPHNYLSRDKSINLFHLVMDREHGIDRRHYVHNRSSLNFCADFFKCIPPNLTIANVEKHTNFLRKFSPDGKYLICFSRDQQSFESYKFIGVSNVCAMLYNWKSEYIPLDCVTGLGGYIRQNIFNQLFKLHWSIQLTSSFMRPLYREFSIFTEDGKYVIIASHLPIPEEHLPSYYTLNSIGRMHLDYDMFWYRFFMVKLSDGSVSDTIEFPYDYIKLSHNHGVSLKGNLMIVVSLFHQLIHVLKVKDGKFSRFNIIGRYPHGTYECMCKHVPEYENFCQTLDAGDNGLKQKIIIFLYRKVLNFDVSQRTAMIQLFYRRLYVYDAMQIYKLQFLDQDHLLIRYDLHKTPNVHTDALHKFFVVYNLVEDEVMRVSAENAFDLLWYYVFFCDYFRDSRSLFTGRTPSSTSNSWELLYNQSKMITEFQLGQIEAAYRLLPQLPLSVESYSPSPYLDLNIFKYESNLISNLERPRYSDFQPIPFYDRESNLLLYRLYLGIFDHQNTDQKAQMAAAAAPKELVAFVFHPFEPFFISLQKIGNCFVTNFHIRNAGTIVRK